MKLFFGKIDQQEAYLDIDEQQHLSKVLRMKAGEELFVTDGMGNLAKGILYYEGKKAWVEVVEIREPQPEFPYQLHIAIAPTKNMDRIDFFVEKATEMNIAEITFLQTDQSERKHLNIEKIIKQSIAASKQSHRLYFPKINGLTKLSDFAKTIIPSATYIAHCDESFARTSLAQLKTQNNITILIGPEGDFSTNEIKTLSELGIQSISLGSQRLRTETAGILVAAWNYSQSFE